MKYLILIMVFAFMSSLTPANSQILKRNSDKKLFTQKYKNKNNRDSRELRNSKRVRGLKKKRRLDKRKRKRVERLKRRQARARKQRVKRNKKLYGTPDTKYYSSSSPTRIFKGDR